MKEPTPQSFAEPVVLLSDLHIGHPATYLKDPAQIIPLLEGSKTVIFNGDTFEMRLKSSRPTAEKFRTELDKICADLGVTPVYLNGNHDPIVSKIDHLDLFDDSVLVTHGDILFHKISPWSREADLVGPAHEELLKELSDAEFVDFEKRLYVSKRASLALEMHQSKLSSNYRFKFSSVLRECWPPWRPFYILWCWFETPWLAARVAWTFRPEAKLVLIGHTHHAGVWKRRGRTIINTGSFLPFSDCLVVRIENGTMAVNKVIRQRKQFVTSKEIWRTTLPAE